MTSLPTAAPPSLGAMAAIESRRLARNPVFVVGVVIAFAIPVSFLFLGDEKADDLLSWPVMPAFFMGLTALIAMARQTRNTEDATAVLDTAPGTEARRTQALLLACLLPAAISLVWFGEIAIVIAISGTYPQEWWFDTMPDWQVVAIMIATTPVACLGGALLGVLVGRWLRFPGAAAVAVVVLVVVDMVGQFAVDGHPASRLWVPWAMFHSGTQEDGTADLYAGNPAFYGLYALSLCAAAAIAAVWHDRTARTDQLKRLFVAVVVVGLACLALAAFTGNEHNQASDPVPAKVND